MEGNGLTVGRVRKVWGATGKWQGNVGEGLMTLILFCLKTRARRKLAKLLEGIWRTSILVYGNLPSKVKEKCVELESIHLEILSGNSGGKLVIKEKVVYAELQNLLSAEESFLRQKPRISWIKEGGQNSKFFHSMLAFKHNQQTIKSLTNAHGQVLDTQDEISIEAISFYEKLLGTRDASVSGVLCGFL
ncbi:hypothetical protein V6N13_016419 [Hibiscus sabdariffa]